MEPRDIPGAIGLQRVCFPAPFPEEMLWNSTHLDRHIKIFPEGQFVATHHETVVGSASALVVSEAAWQAHGNWESTTGGLFLQAHDPKGTTLYAVDVSVHPEFRGQGVGRALYQARFDLVTHLGLKRFGTACRIPDFMQWHRRTGGSVSEYADTVENGETIDRTLTPLLRYGLRRLDVLQNYMEDEESAHAAVLLEWIP